MPPPACKKVGFVCGRSMWEMSISCIITPTNTAIKGEILRNSDTSSFRQAHATVSAMLLYINQADVGCLIYDIRSHIIWHYGRGKDFLIEPLICWKRWTWPNQSMSHIDTSTHRFFGQGLSYNANLMHRAYKQNLANIQFCSVSPSSRHWHYSLAPPHGSIPRH